MYTYSDDTSATWSGCRCDRPTASRSIGSHQRCNGPSAPLPRSSSRFQVRPAASSYLVQADDAAGRTWNLLLDLGNGALGPLQRWCDPMDLDAVGLSHLHLDHVADVSSLYVYLRYVPGPARHRPLPVHGPFGTASRL